MAGHSSSSTESRRDDLPRPLVELKSTLGRYLTAREVDEIQRAYELGERAHRGQSRKSGEPYIFHPIAVAQILADISMDADTIVAAILHDTIEDTEVTKEAVSEAFGVAVGEIVDGVTKLDKMQFSSAAEAQAESFRKMMLAMARDIRVILIKLADRLHNMRTIDAMSRPSQRRIARETLDIYAPIAQRLGIDSFRRELQDLAFRALYPLRYRVLRKHAEDAMGRHQEKLNTIGNALKTRLEAASISCTIDGRVKTPYSTYEKMHAKTMGLKHILDILGFRIVVPEVGDCYHALGVVHNLYRPRFDRFKDYIAIPKANGYQGLHTVLVGPFGHPIEVQIRTEEMDQVAERGIAAHWVYKLKENAGGNTAGRARDWLLGVLEMQQKAGSSVDFLEHVRVDLFPDEVYVFTPNGDIRALPKNATILDFAYSVHTDVGDHAVHGMIDGQLAPLRQPLNSGDTVKIITAPSAMPRSAWLDFVVTGKARTAIRHHLRGLDHEEAVKVGHLMLDSALAEIGHSLDTVGERRTDEYLKSIGLPRLEELLAEIALGNRMPALVASQLTDDPTLQSRKSPDKASEVFALTGRESRVVTYANCCHPIPDDKIMGYLSAGKGLVVHRSNCRNIKEFRKHPDRWLDVEWHPARGQMFSVSLQVETENRTGVLARIATAISQMDTNIQTVLNREIDGATSELHFVIEVTNRQHLARTMRKIRRTRDVVSVHRS